METAPLPNLTGGLNAKYRLTEDRLVLADGREVFRIEALADFSDVQKGDLGGYVGSESDLDTGLADHSWVYDNSIVYGNTQDDTFTVSGHSTIRENSEVDRSRVYGGSSITQSRIYDSVVEDAMILHSKVSGGSEVHHAPQVSHSTIVDTQMIEMGVVDYARAERSRLSTSDVMDSVVEDSELVSSIVKKNSDVLHSSLTHVTAHDHTIISGSTITRANIENRSDVYNSRDIQEVYLNESSLNSMGHVVGGDFRNTHMRECEVNQATVIESDVRHSNLSKESKITKSDIRLSSLSASIVSNSHLRHSRVENDVLDSVGKRDYVSGMNLNDEDIQDLGGQSLQR